MASEPRDKTACTPRRLGRIQLSDTLLGCAEREQTREAWLTVSLLLDIFYTKILGRLTAHRRTKCEHPNRARAAHANMARKERGGWTVGWAGEAGPDGEGRRGAYFTF